MAGRADKGIILTTGTFTSEAKREAVRDGVPPRELGLKPSVVFEIDLAFFDDFQK